MQKAIQNGILGGLAGGLMFGVIMTMFGMLTTIANLVGSNNQVVGAGVHFLSSAIFGLLFGLLFASRITSIRGGMMLGMVYGVMWWVLGVLVIMPLLLGKGVQVTQALTPMNLMSLMGHLMYGAVMGGLYVKLFSVEPLTDEVRTLGGA